MNSGPVHRALAFVFLGTVCCLGLVGCGGTGDVSGKVTFNGAPVKGGTVTFASVGEGPSFTGLIEEDGTYTVRGVRAGNYKVCVETESLRPRSGPASGPPAGTGSGSGSKGGPPGRSGPPPGTPPPGGGGPPDLVKAAQSGKIKTGPPGGSEEPEDVKAHRSKDGFATMADNAKRYVAIPAEYGKPETTELSFTAKSGAQTFDLVLKGK